MSETRQSEPLPAREPARYENLLDRLNEVAGRVENQAEELLIKLYGPKPDGYCSKDETQNARTLENSISSALVKLEMASEFLDTANSNITGDLGDYTL